ncbi:hypothetical protein M408DRAFT_332548 [Serendipita vermifera MAFF 305830]|uniref:F-box domain-containing protein n=1 Tax=Serendipita vermifera MAFF 305830 TaxID=933852 RepID=A0A0C2X0N5_SERVB|nr:hypothetical protein M408DRAFT_332548 [Serendipita vermifera MAFF 305830]
MGTLLDRLPYDILRLVFGFLDVKTLLDAALASHAINEIASLQLYTSIIVNPGASSGFWYSRPPDYEERRNPFKALARRPHLRKIVRSVVLFTSGSWMEQENNDPSAESCYEALFLLHAVTSITVKYYPMETEHHLLSKWLSQLHNINTLCLTGFGQLPKSHELPLSSIRHIDAQLTKDALLKLSNHSVAPKVRSFSGHIYRRYLPFEELSGSLAPFTGLTRFSYDTRDPLTPSEICLLVAGLPRLCEGSFVCKLQVEDEVIIPTGAKHLTYLRILFLPKESPSNQVKILKKLLQCVAGDSRLRKLDIDTSNRTPKILNGDAILGHIVSTHGDTLQKLKLANFHLSSTHLKCLLLSCKQLEALWLGLPPHLKPHFPKLLGNSTSLEKVRLYAAGKWDFGYANALLQQSCPSLNALKVCSRFGHQADRAKTTWKAHWEYDAILNAQVRWVVGPAVINYLEGME